MIKGICRILLWYFSKRNATCLIYKEPHYHGQRPRNKIINIGFFAIFWYTYRDYCLSLLEMAQKVFTLFETVTFYILSHYIIFFIYHSIRDLFWNNIVISLHFFADKSQEAQNRYCFIQLLSCLRRHWSVI